MFLEDDDIIFVMKIIVKVHTLWGGRGEVDILWVLKRGEETLMIYQAIWHLDDSMVEMIPKAVCHVDIMDSSMNWRVK